MTKRTKKATSGEATVPAPEKTEWDAIDEQMAEESAATGKAPFWTEEQHAAANEIFDQVEAERAQKPQEPVEAKGAPELPPAEEKPTPLDQRIEEAVSASEAKHRAEDDGPCEYEADLEPLPAPVVTDRELEDAAIAVEEADAGKVNLYRIGWRRAIVAADSLLGEAETLCNSGGALKHRQVRALRARLAALQP